MNYPDHARATAAETNRDRSLRRAALLLDYCNRASTNGLTRQRMAEELGYTPASLRTLIYRARKRIAQEERTHA